MGIKEAGWLHHQKRETQTQAPTIPLHELVRYLEQKATASGTCRLVRRQRTRAILRRDNRRRANSNNHQSLALTPPRQSANLSPTTIIPLPVSSKRNKPDQNAKYKSITPAPHLSTWHPQAPPCRGRKSSYIACGRSTDGRLFS